MKGVTSPPDTGKNPATARTPPPQPDSLQELPSHLRGPSACPHHLSSCLSAAVASSVVSLPQAPPLPVPPPTAAGALSMLIGQDAPWPEALSDSCQQLGMAHVPVRTVPCSSLPLLHPSVTYYSNTEPTTHRFPNSLLLRTFAQTHPSSLLLGPLVPAANSIIVQNSDPLSLP